MVIASREHGGEVVLGIMAWLRAARAEDPLLLAMVVGSGTTRRGAEDMAGAKKSWLALRMRRFRSSAVQTQSTVQT